MGFIIHIKLSSRRLAPLQHNRLALLGLRNSGRLEREPLVRSLPASMQISELTHWSKFAPRPPVPRERYSLIGSHLDVEPGTLQLFSRPDLRDITHRVQSVAYNAPGKPLPAKSPPLTNPTNLTGQVSSGISVLAQLSPSGVRISLRDSFARTSSSKRPRGSRRACTEFTDRSRSNLVARALELHAMCCKPALIVTLTYPGQRWLSTLVVSGSDEDGYLTSDLSSAGRESKRHLTTFRKRLERYAKSNNFTFGCLWFLEFQRRGAPHYHLMFFDVLLDDLQLSEFSAFVSLSWAEVVGHLEPLEFQKHLEHGSRVERMRVDHFGYAVKYGSKMTQKDIPLYFGRPGRLWGVWNFKPLKVLFVSVPIESLEDLECVNTVLDSTFSTVQEFSERFYRRCTKLHEAALGQGRLNRVYGVKVYGQTALDVFLSCLGLDPADTWSQWHGEVELRRELKL